MKSWTPAVPSQTRPPASLPASAPTSAGGRLMNPCAATPPGVASVVAGARAGRPALERGAEDAADLPESPRGLRERCRHRRGGVGCLRPQEPAQVARAVVVVDDERRGDEGGAVSQ